MRVSLQGAVRWACLASAAVVAFAATEPLPAVDGKWRHYASDHFELYSHSGEYESRSLLHDLELLRAVFAGQFKFVERARVDVTVYLFRTVGEFTAYGAADWQKDHKFRGYYLKNPDRAVISVAPAEDPAAARAVIFHEYIHHLFRAAEFDPPAWFNEGIAEMLGAMKVVNAEVEMGRPHAGRIGELRESALLPLETLFAIDEHSPVYRSNAHVGVFYAQSWALLHYWYFGNSGFSKEAVGRYVHIASDRKAAAATNLRDWFKECFGIDYPEMQRRLASYIRSGSYRYGRQPAPAVPESKTYATRAVPVAEVRLRLAELALRTSRSAMAKFVLVDAAAQAGAEPRVFEVLGSDALAERDETGARERWESALAAGSMNPAIFRELGLLEARTWFRDFDYDFRLPAEVGERVRARLLRAIEHEPNQSAAYELLAWVEAFGETPVLANIKLVEKQFAALKNKPRTLLALAFARVRTQQFEDAKELLRDLASVQPDDWTAYAAEQVSARLEHRDPRPVPRRGPGIQVNVAAPP